MQATLESGALIWLSIAEVAELADALGSGPSELFAHGGSNPPFGTTFFSSRVPYVARLCSA